MTTRVWVQHGEYRLAVNDTPGEEPAFVLMHGFPDDSHLYDALVPQLAGRRVVTFDFLGRGESDKPRNHEYTFEGQLEELHACVAQRPGQDSQLRRRLGRLHGRQDRHSARGLHSGPACEPNDVRARVRVRRGPPV